MHRKKWTFITLHEHGFWNQYTCWFPSTATEEDVRVAAMDASNRKVFAVVSIDEDEACPDADTMELADVE